MLWQNATLFEEIKRGYLEYFVTKIHCGPRPQHLYVKERLIKAKGLDSLVVPKDHNIWLVTVIKIPGYFYSKCGFLVIASSDNININLLYYANEWQQYWLWNGLRLNGYQLVIHRFFLISYDTRVKSGIIHFSWIIVDFACRYY